MSICIITFLTGFILGVCMENSARKFYEDKREK